MTGLVTCNYYGNQGVNLSANYCQNAATFDWGRYIRVVGLPYKVRFACDEHAVRLGFTGRYTKRRLTVLK